MSTAGHIQNSIVTGSDIFAGFTVVTDRQNHQQTDHATRVATASAAMWPNQKHKDC